MPLRLRQVRRGHAAAGLAAALLLALSAHAAQIAPAEGEPVPDWIRVPAYSKRTTDPAAVERGRALFIANGCSFCHGADARGGNGGPNLLRTQTVLRDNKGELIATPIRKGVPNSAMVAFALKDAEIADVAEFLHSFDAFGSDRTRLKPAVFTMGSAAAGKRYFASHCVACHSVTADLKGIAARFEQPRDLQQHWLMPRSKEPTLVRVTFPDATVLDGQLVRMDEFLVTLTLPDGRERSIELRGATPRVDVDSPLAAHKAMLPGYRDDDIHDVTAYLETLK